MDDLDKTNCEDDADDYVIHEANCTSLEDYAHELAFLLDLTEPSITTLDYDSPYVKNTELSGIQQQQRLIDVLKKHESIMISSGNALPSPAYGVVCDIDVDGHAPIKQQTRGILLRFLQKLYELLKGLLKEGLIAPWASPIGIVLKKNDEDIRLCIDYKLVNHVTIVIEYDMVDDLLTELESYLWFCSLDAASGFWAILMTMRGSVLVSRRAPILRLFDKDKEVYGVLYANAWALSATLMQMHDDKIHPVRFCGRVFKDAEMNYHSAEKEVLALFSTLAWVHKSKSLFGRAVQFAVLLSPWKLEIERIKEKDCAYSQLLHSTIT
ncbi:hypothetical protein PHMEG_00021472 [Phytophthora megakarya]|uniref:Reverse transcriptase/retrotransposon-derived protein RNase H-like domain-containing protein n=1 Tax=Phytophthora megakarya TaxID=4795 RepID=A0A225VLT0_9STRA|nr:hypothetical protein PHMEG_00021472 [Phytophthora megakarya]